MPKSIHQMLAAAYKAITVDDLGDSRLKPEQAERFIRIVEKESVLLGSARRLTMNADRRNIDRTGFSDRILKAPQSEGEQFTDYEKPDFFTNELIAVKARGAAWVSDEALEENIERDNFENTLVDMIASQAAIDLEELLLDGDTGASDTFLALTDGWLVTAEQQLDGSGDTDFVASDVEDMFDAMLEAVDEKYLRNLDDWRFDVTYSIEKAYREVLRQRETALGDSAQTGSQQLAYEGVRLRRVPVMPSGTARLSNRNNDVYGIRRDIEIEPERKADHDRWDFHVRVKADAHYEDENAAVTAVGFSG